MTEKILPELNIRTYQQTDMEDVIHIWKECGSIGSWNNPKSDIQLTVKKQKDLFAMFDYCFGGAAAALIKAGQAEAKAQGWSVARWITRDHNYCARGIYGNLAEKTNWELNEMAAK